MLSLSNLSNILRFRCKDKQIISNETTNSQQNAIFGGFSSLRLLRFSKIAVNCDFLLVCFPRCQLLSQKHPLISNAKVVAQGIQNAVVVYRGGRKVSLLLQ